MSRREQSDRHIIWSNMNLEADDWRDSYKEYLEINGLDDDPNDENKLYEYMVEANDDYLSDERRNLDIQFSQPIIVIGDLGRWNGRVTGYKMIDSGNITGLPLFRYRLYRMVCGQVRRPSSQCRSSRRYKPLSVPCIQRRCYRYAD